MFCFSNCWDFRRQSLCVSWEWLMRCHWCPYTSAIFNYRPNYFARWNQSQLCALSPSREFPEYLEWDRQKLTFLVRLLTTSSLLCMWVPGRIVQHLHKKVSVQIFLEVRSLLIINVNNRNLVNGFAPPKLRKHIGWRNSFAANPAFKYIFQSNMF